MNFKKGILLLETVIRIVISVIALAILIYLGFVLYSWFSGNSELKQAQNSLDSLLSQIEGFVQSTISQREFKIFKPQGWYLQIFDLARPNVKGCNAYGQCICICKKVGVQGCEEKGVCRTFNDPVYKLVPSQNILRIKSPLSIIRIAKVKK